jgi:hypothetical protein
MSVLVWAVQPISGILRARSTLQSWALPYGPEGRGRAVKRIWLNQRPKYRLRERRVRGQNGGSPSAEDLLWKRCSVLLRGEHTE